MTQAQNQIKPNGVNGNVSSGNRSSPGITAYPPRLPRGIPDRQTATVALPFSKATRMGTWNVRALNQDGKLQNVIQEMKRININILGLCETRMKNNGDIKCDEHRLIYSGGNTHTRGVGILLDKESAKCVERYWQLSERVMLVKIKGKPFNLSIIVVYAPTSDSDEADIDRFYDQLEKAKSQCKSQEVVLVIGDLNAKVGHGAEGKIKGKYGLGEQNERGERFVQWCAAKEQVITNTWFQEHPRRLWTWRSPGGETKNQIDYITINQRFRNAVQHCKTYPGADCGSDHLPVVCKLKIRLKKLKSKRWNLSYFMRI